MILIFSFVLLALVVLTAWDGTEQDDF